MGTTVDFATSFLHFSVWYGCVLSSHGESWAKYNLAEPIPLQVEHVAVEFIVKALPPSGPFLLTMKISAQQCRVDTSYFTHNWETHGGWEHLIPSRTGPKDLPTAPSVLLLFKKTHKARTH